MDIESTETFHEYANKKRKKFSALLPLRSRHFNHLISETIPQFSLTENSEKGHNNFYWITFLMP